MSQTKLMSELNNILRKNEERYYSDGVLNKATVIEDLHNYDPELITLLTESDVVKRHFLIEVNGKNILKVNDLIEVFEMNEYWDDSYTAYANKIGLASHRTFFSNDTNVVLDFPYKDTVLKASMSKEEREQEDLLPAEPFFNEKMAREEIDILFANKLLVRATKYDAEGKYAATEFSEEDNLILKGNNLLALHTIKEKMNEKVKLIYIDPPYNTGNDSFIYNDNFNHSTWLTFMKNRLETALSLLSDSGSIFVQCDDSEQAYLKVLMDEIFGRDNFIACLPTIMNLKGNQDEFGFAGTHEYILVYAKNKEITTLYDLPIDDPDKLDEWEEDEIGFYKKGANLKATGVNAPREKRPNLYFPVYISKNKEIFLEQQKETDYELYPITNGKEMSWRWQYSTMEKNLNDIIVTGTPGNYSIYKKQRPSLGDLPTKRPKSVFYKPTYSSGNGTNQLRKLFGDRVFNYAKPEELLRDIIEIGSQEGDTVLDFFMGSATTQAVAHKMNRRYIGIEQMDYINTVSVPRLQKVIDGEQGGISKDVDWQGGGSVVYVEMMEKNTGYLKDILNAESTERLREVFNLMLEYANFDFRVDLKEVKDSVWQLPLEDQKRMLVKIIDKNQLYYNYSEIDDENVRDLISNSDYAFNKSFYDDIGDTDE